jgi:hypothetical protein
MFDRYERSLFVKEHAQGLVSMCADSKIRLQVKLGFFFIILAINLIKCQKKSY